MGGAGSGVVIFFSNPRLPCTSTVQDLRQAVCNQEGVEQFLRTLPFFVDNMKR
jgi:hypothetical protein